MQKQKFFRLSLGWQIIIGLVLGIVLGQLFYHNKAAITVMQNIGTMFISLIQMIVLPIVISCLTVGIANMGDIRKLGRIGLKTLIYFEVMTTLAIIIGIVVANITHPGTYININDLKGSSISQYTASASTAKHSGIWSVLMGIIPTNIFAAMGKGDMLPIIFFSVLFGLGTASLGEQGKIITDLLNAVANVMFKVTNWVMRTAPIGVCALIGVTVAEMGFDSLKPLALFIVIAYATMAFFVFVVMYLVGRLFHVDFYELFRIIENEFVLAFTTASSEAALPKMMDKMQKYGASKGIVSFVIPTGYTFNLDGSAIYQSLAALFLAQAYHINLSLGQQITLVIVLMLTSKGMAGVPGASFVVLLATVSTIGVPMQGLTFIAGIDRLVDMGRTAVNVVGNSLATIIIAKSEDEFDDEKRKKYVSEYKRGM
ncbi:cation:dicarboxylate symporter family transporter [Companilactobacillus hulinensis]|uniref:cation:dicarboxylate symporter family transporter n=1 Tax=Companilactobacillus hulinensis TaxID=2486007 RepID=UPI000F76D4D4|nr:cation:dicarboxylase symporter family transporter [Companilactobacillus hulinensis]